MKCPRVSASVMCMQMVGLFSPGLMSGNLQSTRKLIGRIHPSPQCQRQTDSPTGVPGVGLVALHPGSPKLPLHLPITSLRSVPSANAAQLCLSPKRHTSIPSSRRCQTLEQQTPTTTHRPQWPTRAMLPSRAAASSLCFSVKPLSERSGPSHSRPLSRRGANERAYLQSSLVLRFVNNDFQENKEPTIGGTALSSSHRLSARPSLADRAWLTRTAAFLTQKCNLPTRTIKFEIWDTAGQERFASLAPMYYRNAQAALVVYDLTKPTSLIKAKHWVAELQRQASPGIVISLVGNKLDLTNDGAGDGGGEEGAAEDSGDARKVTTEEAKTYAEEEGLLFFETSAKTGYNVTEVFTAIANAIPETSLKTARGPNASHAPSRTEEQRVNLNGPRDSGARDSCAC